jgi:hypothetical protein
MVRNKAANRLINLILVALHQVRKSFQAAILSLSHQLFVTELIHPSAHYIRHQSRPNP